MNQSVISDDFILVLRLIIASVASSSVAELNCAPMDRPFTGGSFQSWKKNKREINLTYTIDNYWNCQTYSLYFFDSLPASFFCIDVSKCFYYSHLYSYCLNLINSGKPGCFFIWDKNQLSFFTCAMRWDKKTANAFLFFKWSYIRILIWSKNKKITILTLYIWDTRLNKKQTKDAREKRREKRIEYIDVFIS